MMNNIKKLSSILIISLIGWISKVSAIIVYTVRDTKDTKYDMAQIDGSNSILSIISLVNDYLWFAIWFFCFIFMIWNWYKLISANWDETVMSSAKKALLWSGIWIVVCLLAYIIVNLAVRLFA